MNDLLSDFDNFSKLSTRRRVMGMEFKTKRFLIKYLKDYMEFTSVYNRFTFTDFLVHTDLAASTRATIAMGLGKYFWVSGIVTKEDFDIIKDSFRAPITPWSTSELNSDHVAIIMDAVMKQSRSDTVSKRRNPLVISFLATFGPRVSQLTELKIWDVKFDNDVLTINLPRKKDNRRSIAPGLDTKNLNFHIKVGGYDLKALFFNYYHWRKNQSSDYFFLTATGNPLPETSIFKLCRWLGKIVNLPKLHPHNFRHYVGTTIANKFNATAAAIVLGHSSIMSTQKYINPSLTDTTKIIGMI